MEDKDEEREGRGVGGEQKKNGEGGEGGGKNGEGGEGGGRGREGGWKRAN